MTPVMNPLYEYVLEHILEQYYHETAYYEIGRASCRERVLIQV